MTKTGDTFEERFIAAVAAAESADRQTKHEIRQGYPLATEAEVDMMLRAFKKHGSLPHSLAHAKQILASPIFCNWDWRPAVLVGDEAFAVLEPGGPWVSVDEFDVRHTGGVLTEEAWRRTFIREFGPLDTWRWRPGQDNIPQSRPLPRAKDFDDAARVAARVANLAHTADLAHRIATSPLFLVPEIEASPIAP
jgi:hypothetical protein